jgi:fibronectin type 3 domain-containing protein
LSTCTANVDGPGVCNVVVVQRIINAALGEPCVTGPGVTSSSVSLSWTASTSSTAAGYNVYRASALDGPFTKLTATPITGTTYTDNTAQASSTYYYAVTAVDASSNESAYSAAAQSVVP